MKKTAAIMFSALVLVACLYSCTKTEPQNAGITPTQSAAATDLAQNSNVTTEPSTDVALKEVGLKSSKDDPDYLDDMSAFPLSMDFNSDGVADTLSIELIEDPEDDLNYPIAIKLVIDGYELLRDGLFGDGIGLKIINLDTADAFLDICVFVYGTDVSAEVFVYRYDGETIDLYTIICVGDAVSFLYDTKGTVCYNTYLEEPDILRYVHVTYYYMDDVESYVDIEEEKES